MQLGLCNNRFEKDIHTVSLSHAKAMLIWGFMMTFDFVISIERRFKYVFAMITKRYGQGLHVHNKKILSATHPVTEWIRDDQSIFQ